MTEYGKVRLYNDLVSDGYIVEFANDNAGIDYVVIKDYMIEFGNFAGQVIDLGIPAPKDYPRVAGACIHIKSIPHILDKKDTIPGKRNILDSKLGSEWRYWSFRFNLSSANPTKDLMSQINGILRII